MIGCSFHIFETIVHALIDPGSTHSYVCTSILSLGSLPKSETRYDILVINPLGHSVIMNRVYKDCPIRIREYEFSRDLMWRPMCHQYFYFYDKINYQCKYKYISNTVDLCYLFLDTIQIILKFLI